MKKVCMQIGFLFLLILPGIICAQNLHFAFLTDLHVSPGTNNDKYLHAIVREINNQSFDFVVVTGDLTNTGANDELNAVKNALDSLKAPLLIIPGNHETNWSESAGTYFNELWGNDRFICEKNGFLLVGFNTGPYMKMGDGHVKEEDLQWLKRELKSASVKGKTLVAFSHYPLNEGLDNWPDVTGILKDFNCITDFCGHGHRLSKYNFDGIPGIMGRPLDLKNGASIGYNIVRIADDSIFIYEKILGESIPKEWMAYNFKDFSSFAGLPVSPKPDFTVNDTCRIVKKTFEWSDTASIFAGLCFVNDTLIVYGNSLGWVKALQTKTGRVIWQKRYSGPLYSTPVYCSGIVAFGTVDGHIKGVQVKTGNELWDVNTGRPVLAEGMAKGNYLYIGGGDKAFYKINAASGNVEWIFKGINGLIQGKPAFAKHYVVFGAWDRHLYCLDSRNGNLVWKWNNGKPQKLYSPGNIVPAISNGKVFIVAPDRYMTALDLVSGKEIWRSGAHMVRESMGCSPDRKNIYAKLMNDTLISVSAVANKPVTLWARFVGTGYDHNPCEVVSSKTMVIGANKNGLLVAVDPRNQRVLWKYKSGNSAVNKIVLPSNSKIWVSTIQGKLIRLEKED